MKSSTFIQTNPMTINITETSLYIGTIVILIAIQIYHQRRISKLEKEVDDIWLQLGVITQGITTKLMDLLKDLNNKQDKNENKRNS
jgi:hypothetical protein